MYLFHYSLRFFFIFKPFSPSTSDISRGSSKKKTTKKTLLPSSFFLPHFSISALSSTLAAPPASSCRAASSSSCRRSCRWPWGANESEKATSSADTHLLLARLRWNSVNGNVGTVAAGCGFSSLSANLWQPGGVKAKQSVLNCSLAGKKKPRGSLSPKRGRFGLPPGAWKADLVQAGSRGRPERLLLLGPGLPPQPQLPSPPLCSSPPLSHSGPSVFRYAG